MNDEANTTQQELDEMKGVCKNLDAILETLIDSARPKADMASESKFYCALAFLEPVIKNIKKFI
jgi:hypothetical protein